MEAREREVREERERAERGRARRMLWERSRNWREESWPRVGGRISILLWERSRWRREARLPISAAIVRPGREGLRGGSGARRHSLALPWVRCVEMLGPGKQAINDGDR